MANLYEWLWKLRFACAQPYKLPYLRDVADATADDHTHALSLYRLWRVPGLNSNRNWVETIAEMKYSSQ